MIGLSATPNRKDGLTRVLSWFLGPVIVKKVLDDSRNIGIPHVNIIKYNNSQVPKYMYNGKLIIADMINQIAIDPIRNGIIIENIIKLLINNRKIIVLVDRRNHCTELKRLLDEYYNSINCSPNTITVGLYLGGSTQNDLLEASKCNVIIGCYAMCAEAFDVPDLDTLIFASPRSDIVQSCGRILRQKNKNSPYIVDIVDKILYNQYRARYSFYKKNNYTIFGHYETREPENAISADMFLSE